MTGRERVQSWGNLRRCFFLLFAWIFALPVTHAPVCDLNGFEGTYLWLFLDWAPRQLAVRRGQ